MSKKIFDIEYRFMSGGYVSVRKSSSGITNMFEKIIEEEKESCLSRITIQPVIKEEEFKFRFS